MCHGQPTNLGSRAFDLLVYLVVHRDRVVAKEELLDHVWPGLAVEEANLSVHVSALRKVLGPSSLSTVPGRGYRFVEPVETAPRDTPALRPVVPVPTAPSLAVLPFANLSGDPEQDAFADGLVEDIITTLSRISGLTVIARASSFAYRTRDLDVRQIGHELRVGHVLDGSLRNSDGRARISARLVDTQTGAQVWAERYDRTISDIFALQDELALILVTELQVHLTDGEQARLRYPTMHSYEAWTYWVRGLACYRRAVLSREGMLPALMAWQKAAAIDARSATISAMLGMLYYLDARFGFWNDRDTAIGKGKAHVERALSIDATCSDAHIVQGLLLLLQHRHAEAVEATRRAVELGPQSADVAAFAAFVLANAGLGGEAILHIERATRLAPVFPSFYWGHMGLAYRAAGQVPEAIAAFTNYQAANPGRGLTDLIAMHHQRGEEDAARTWAAQLIAALPDFRIGAWKATQFSTDETSLMADMTSLRAVGLPD
jgi:adenylate cyclase